MNIELDNVSKNFKNQTVLENVNLKLESGKIYGLVGRNGSGKSVLLKIMTGLMEPSDGIIKYGGIPLKKGQYAKDVGIVLDCIGFMPEYTAKENLLLLARLDPTNTHQLPKIDVNLQAIVSDVIQALQPFALEKNIQITTHIADDLSIFANEKLIIKKS